MFNARYFQARYFAAQYFNAEIAPPDSPPVEVITVSVRGAGETKKPAIVASLYVTERPDRLIATATITVKEFDDAALDRDLLAIVMLT